MYSGAKGGDSTAGNVSIVPIQFLVIDRENEVHAFIGIATSRTEAMIPIKRLFTPEV